MFGSVDRKLPMSRLACLAVASSVLLAPMAMAKHASFEMPTCEKLMEGDGPDATKTASPSASKSSSKDLTPMKLTNDEDAYTVGADGKVKMQVQQNVEGATSAATAGEDPTASSSVVGTDKLKAKLLKDSQKVSVAPMALQETEEEAQKKADTISDAERAQLTDLWTATINRSPDIQFVINRLQPSSEGSHVTAKAIQLIGGALFSAVQAAPLMMPGGANMGMFMGTSSGVSMLQGLLNEQTGKNVKKQQISQEQATMLYSIVRQTAEKVVVEYRKYRQNRSDFGRANSDLEDLKSMVAAAQRNSDAAKQIEMEYTIRKAQRDVEKIIDEAKLHRQQLIDLAGSDAVARLDTQMDEETNALAKLVGSGSDPVSATNLTPPGPLKDEIKAPRIQTATSAKKDRGPM